MATPGSEEFDQRQVVVVDLILEVVVRQFDHVAGQRGASDGAD